MHKGAEQGRIKEDMDRILDDVLQEAEATFGSMSEDSLNWRPGAGKWSIAECLEHLILSVEEYTPKILEAVRRDPRTAGPSNQVTSGLRGRIFVWACHPDTTMKMPAPKSFRPKKTGEAPAGPSELGDDIVDRFLTCYRDFQALMDQHAGADWHRVIVVTPETSLVKFRLADAFTLLSVHSRRHLNQALRVMKAAGFPDQATAAV